MAVRPQDRYASPRELSDDVERWLADERVHAHAEPWYASFGRWARRHRTTVSASAGLLIAAAILLGVSTITFREMHQEAEVLREQADKALAAGQRSAYVNAVRLAREHWEDSDLKDIPELLASAGPAELRSWEWGHLNELLHGPTRTLIFPARTANFALSPDGTRLAVASQAGQIKMWDSATGGEILDARSGAGPVLTFSADGQRLIAVASIDDPQKPGQQRCLETKSWQAADGRALETQLTRPGRTPLAISSDGTRVIVFDNSTASVRDVASGRELFTLTEARPDAVAFSADGKWLAVGGGRPGGAGDRREWGQVDLWEIATGKKRLSLPDQWYHVTALAFNSSGQELAIGTKNGLVTRWDLSANKPSQRPLWEHTGPIQSLAYSGDGAWLASGGADRAIALVHLTEDKEPLRTLRGHYSPVTGLAFDPASKQLISAGTAINFWDMSKSAYYVKSAAGSDRIAFHPDGKTLACRAGGLVLVDVGTGEVVPTLEKLRKDASITSFALDAKRQRVAVGRTDGSVSIQDLSGGPAVLLQAHKSEVQHLAFSPDAGGPLASGDKDGVVKLWDQTGRELLTLAPPKGWRMMAFSPDGKHLAFAGRDDVVTLCDPISGRETAWLTTGAGAVEALAFDPKHSRLATAHEEGRLVKLWDLTSSRELRAIRPSLGKIEAMTFSSDGRRLVTGAHPGRIKLWDLACGAEVFEINLVTLLSLETSVRDLAFSPDGLTLAAATDSAGIFFWKAMPWLDPSASVAQPEVHR
jgi:WD40 repeat protein